MLKIAEYDLGHETQFVVVAELIAEPVLKRFEELITDMALGFTVNRGIGGWKGTNEDVMIYHIASLADHQRMTLITFLLYNSSMKDLYVVLPGGMAKGYCLEEEAPKPLTQPQRWNASRGIYRPGSSVDVLHGIQDTGWRKALKEM